MPRYGYIDANESSSEVVISFFFYYCILFCAGVYFEFVANLKQELPKRNLISFLYARLLPFFSQCYFQPCLLLRHSAKMKVVLKT